MSRIRGKNTQPEMTLRKALYALGYRYRLHQSGLPGRPDLVFGKKRKVIWVHGCFWHWHPDERCPIAKIPKSREDYWIAKFERNRARDQRQAKEIQSLGWSAMTVWECQLAPRQLESTLGEIENFLAGTGPERIDH